MDKSSISGNKKNGLVISQSGIVLRNSQNASVDSRACDRMSFRQQLLTLSKEAIRLTFSDGVAPGLENCIVSVLTEVTS